ncbi:DUF3472 domain-containing protein [Polaribacter batillariae]|uniref:DUF3472 domain-containing protein n=1 Tax=Polaribacter batillariae TaxID=2808900 RepID=A0ABX7SRP2_9FLAO|nr:DUF3472 domain-containing protein [Polaribacter batillariae]QTD36920.1 DUF3472 domain-containing protein [Polaribacter batillariae]
MVKRGFSILLLLQIILFNDSCSNETKENNNVNTNFTASVPIGSNSWVTGKKPENKSIVKKEGIRNWTSLNHVINTYIRTGSGKLNLGLKIKSTEGNSKINVTIYNKTKTINVKNKEYKTISVGTFDVTEGYVKIELQGKEKTGNIIADIDEVLLGGTAVATNLNFVPSTNHHFGRRGPSVHLKYSQPENEEVQYFYNEITVPAGEDKLGSFFMANGHAEGYFGIQVNSKTERRVLFSIWSAFVTDNPNQIPKDYTVKSLGGGEGVTIQNFGNEGSGIQSFKNVNWKVDTTYKFLLKGEPSPVAGSTDYTAYFYDPLIEKWQIIASLRRPKTVTYLTRLYSFLENFNPSTGNQTRKAYFENQWVYTTNKKWIEITNGKFTADATANANERLDYAGGVIGDKFFLKNGGFFNENVALKTNFSRKESENSPNIIFSSLPKPKL